MFPNTILNKDGSFMRLLKLLVCLALCSCFTVDAFAHPGRTDSNGGHTDHSTGEYHYHHGYSAHQHYDIDGDGYPDCKYNFDDKTGSSGGSATISKDSSKTSNSPKKIKDEVLAALEPKPSDKVAPAKYSSKTFWGSVETKLGFWWDILYFFFMIILVWLCLIVVCETIEWIIKKIFKR